MITIKDRFYCLFHEDDPVQLSTDRRTLLGWFSRQENRLILDDAGEKHEEDRLHQAGYSIKKVTMHLEIENDGRRNSQGTARGAGKDRRRRSNPNRARSSRIIP